jgi:hypothetical protein
MIELSTAIKCPDVDTFLCTFKIFQYSIQKPEILKKFIPEELIANDISRFFKKIYYISDLSYEESQKLIQELKTNYHNYVVKPQKEGGGNNYYGEDILKLLPKSEEEGVGDILKNSIIMERIFPKEQEAHILKENNLKIANCVSEYSVYGAVISDEKSIILNKSFGFLVRTKETSEGEGGILAGNSAIDLPCFD